MKKQIILFLLGLVVFLPGLALSETAVTILTITQTANDQKVTMSVLDPDIGIDPIKWTADVPLGADVAAYLATNKALIKSDILTTMVAGGTFTPAEQQLAAQAFGQLILTEFPGITKIEDLTPEMIDQYVIDHVMDKEMMGKVMKAILYYVRARGGL